MFAFQTFSAVLFAFMTGEKDMSALMSALAALCASISSQNDDNDRLYAERCAARDRAEGAETRAKDLSDKLHTKLLECDTLREQIRLSNSLDLSHERLARIIVRANGISPKGCTNLINAIKEFRDITKLSLKESKDAIEAAVEIEKNA